MPIDFDALIRRFDEATNKANAANLERYGALLTHLETLGQQVGKQGTFGEASALLSQVGAAARTRIEEQKTKALATTEQGLISRGLGGTTIRATARRGVLSDAERARQEAEDRIAQQKAGLLTQRAGAETQIGGMKAAAIEGRQDVGPDLSVFASLLQAAAAGEAATGGAKRTATILGPNAMAGRDVFGQPLGRFGGSGGGGTGGGGGGLSPSGGGGGGGGGGKAQYFPPGTYGQTGTSRAVPGVGYGELPGEQGPLSTAGGRAGGGVGGPPIQFGGGGGQTFTPEQIQAPGGAESLLESVGIPSGAGGAGGDAGAGGGGGGTRTDKRGFSYRWSPHMNKWILSGGREQIAKLGISRADALIPQWGE